MVIHKKTNSSLCHYLEDSMRKVFNVLSIIGVVIIIQTCQNKITFNLRSDELPDKPMILPIIKDKGLWPAVTLDIDSEKVRLHVDTGGEADAISLTKEQIKKINLKKLNKTRITVNAYGEKRQLHYYMADEIVVDSNRFTNCEIMEMPSADDKFENIGLMGLGFLKYFIVYTDFKNNLIKLYPFEYSKRIIDESWKMIDLDKDNRFKGKLSGYDKEYTIGFDTGAIYVNGEKGYNWIRVDKDELLGKYDTDIEFDYNIITTDIITSKNQEINNLRFIIYETSEPEGVDIFLGYDFFSRYEVIVNYSASILYYR